MVGQIKRSVFVGGLGSDEVGLMTLSSECWRCCASTAFICIIQVFLTDMFKVLTGLMNREAGAGLLYQVDFRLKYILLCNFYEE